MLQRLASVLALGAISREVPTGGTFRGAFWPATRFNAELHSRHIGKVYLNGVYMENIKEIDVAEGWVRQIILPTRSDWKASLQRAKPTRDSPPTELASRLLYGRVTYDPVKTV